MCKPHTVDDPEQEYEAINEYDKLQSDDEPEAECDEPQCVDDPEDEYIEPQSVDDPEPVYQDIWRKEAQRYRRIYHQFVKGGKHIKCTYACVYVLC